MRKILYPMVAYFFEHHIARVLAYYVLVLSLLVMGWGLEPWHTFGIIVVGVLLHVHGLIDGARSAFDVEHGEK